MADWPLKHDGPCACRFVRREEFGEAEQTEWCGLHAAQRDELVRLRAEVAEFQVVAYRREWDGDESDFGNWIYAEADERDDIGVWEPVYAKVPNGFELTGAPLAERPSGTE